MSGVIYEGRIAARVKGKIYKMAVRLAVVWFGDRGTDKNWGLS